MENLSPKKKVTQAGAENRSWGDGGASILPSLILKYSMLSANDVGPQCCCNEPRRRQGLWGGRRSVGCHAILASGPLHGIELQSDELINPQGITLCCPRQLHQGQIPPVLKDAFEKSSCP